MAVAYGYDAGVEALRKKMPKLQIIREYVRIEK